MSPEEPQTPPGDESRTPAGGDPQTAAGGDPQTAAGGDPQTAAADESQTPAGGADPQTAAALDRSACTPCRGTGKLLSNLGGTAHEVVCPWCGGLGKFEQGRDAQTFGPADHGN